VNILGLLLPFWWILFQVDVLRKRFESFLKLISELFKIGCELPLLIFLTFTPVTFTKLFNKRLEDLIDECVQRINGVFTDLTKHHSVVTLICFVDLFTWLNVSKEVTSLTS
jgi:hypothetical protein